MTFAARFQEIRTGFERPFWVANISEIFERHTPLVEPLSLDEAYLDVTENAWGLALGMEVARRLKERTDYVACVVPAFEPGRLAVGLGRDALAANPASSARSTGRAAVPALSAGGGTRRLRQLLP